jgi:SulP family sulfate permease
MAGVMGSNPGIGVAVVLVLDQLAPLVGYSPRGANEVVQFVDLLRHAGQFSLGRS